MIILHDIFLCLQRYDEHKNSVISRSNSTAVLRRNTTTGSAPDVWIKESKRTVSRVGGGAAKGVEKAKLALEEEEEEDESGKGRPAKSGFYLLRGEIRAWLC